MITIFFLHILHFNNDNALFYLVYIKRTWQRDVIYSFRFINHHLEYIIFKTNWCWALFELTYRDFVLYIRPFQMNSSYILHSSFFVDTSGPVQNVDNAVSCVPIVNHQSLCAFTLISNSHFGNCTFFNSGQIQVCPSIWIVLKRSKYVQNVRKTYTFEVSW